MMQVYDIDELYISKNLLNYIFKEHYTLLSKKIIIKTNKEKYKYKDKLLRIIKFLKDFGIDINVQDLDLKCRFNDDRMYIL